MKYISRFVAVILFASCSYILTLYSENKFHCLEVVMDAQNNEILTWKNIYYEDSKDKSVLCFPRYHQLCISKDGEEYKITKIIDCYGNIWGLTEILNSSAVIDVSKYSTDIPPENVSYILNEDDHNHYFRILTYHGDAYDLSEAVFFP